MKTLFYSYCSIGWSFDACVYDFNYIICLVWRLGLFGLVFWYCWSMLLLRLRHTCKLHSVQQFISYLGCIFGNNTVYLVVCIQLICIFVFMYNVVFWLSFFRWILKMTAPSKICWLSSFWQCATLLNTMLLVLLYILVCLVFHLQYVAVFVFHMCLFCFWWPIILLYYAPSNYCFHNIIGFKLWWVWLY